MDKFNPGWFVVYTRPRHEKKIAKQLGQIDIHSFLPVAKMLRTWSDRRKYIDAPLFPSYVFVQLADVQGYFKTLSVDGILHFVKTGKQIARVSDTIIRNLRLIISNTVDGIEISSETIYSGETLVVKDGPFAGFTCEVIQYKGKQRLLVRIEILKRSVLMDIPYENLMPASQLQLN